VTGFLMAKISFSFIYSNMYVESTRARFAKNANDGQNVTCKRNYIIIQQTWQNGGISKNE